MLGKASKGGCREHRAVREGFPGEVSSSGRAELREGPSRHRQRGGHRRKGRAGLFGEG